MQLPRLIYLYRIIVQCLSSDNKTHLYIIHTVLVNIKLNILSEHLTKFNKLYQHYMQFGIYFISIYILCDTSLCKVQYYKYDKILI